MQIVATFSTGFGISFSFALCLDPSAIWMFSPADSKARRKFGAVEDRVDFHALPHAGDGEVAVGAILRCWRSCARASPCRLQACKAGVLICLVLQGKEGGRAWQIRALKGRLN